ncbi:MAG: hypothetical protein IPH45_19595 [Bacteroidales bacterium]|nr:hypothetical protein [Bacteroidales bacterium]
MLRLPRLLFTLILVFLVWFQMQAQTINECAYKRPHEADTWCFYSKIRMGFNSGSPSIQNLPSPLNSGKGCASISDKNGDLLLYTDGMLLWNKNSTLLSNTLSGDLGSTQSSLFVPNPNGLGKYYIFTTHLLYPPPLTTNGLCYSTIHMDSISGVDTLPVKKLLAKTPEKLTGVQHSNGIDFWVVAHGWDNNTFYAYKVSKSGVDSIPVESNVGTIQTGTLNSRNMVGAMKISPDGTKLALAIFGAKLVEWFDFDAGSGKVSNPRQIPSPDAYGPYGIEFSPDGTKLYFTTVYATTNASNNLYQVDLTGAGTPVLLNTLSNNMTALQLAVDGKIYVARYNYAFLGVIENPNRPDIACNYIEDGLSLNGNQGKMGLPNFIQSYLNIPAVTL